MSKIAIILTQGFADWEYAFIAGTGGPFYSLDVQFFGVPTGEIVSQGGLTVSALQGVDDLLLAWEPEVVVVVGGMAWEADDAPDISEILRASYDRGATVAGICGGTLALARSGLLDRVRHTSNDPSFLRRNFPDYKGTGSYAQSASAIVDGRVITAPGTAPTSFTAAVFAAAGLPVETISQFRSMMAAEHA